jgi:hypothetical protein
MIQLNQRSCICESKFSVFHHTSTLVLTYQPHHTQGLVKGHQAGKGQFMCRKDWGAHQRIPPRTQAKTNTRTKRRTKESRTRLHYWRGSRNWRLCSTNQTIKAPNTLCERQALLSSQKHHIMATSQHQGVATSQSSPPKTYITMATSQPQGVATSQLSPPKI